MEIGQGRRRTRRIGQQQYKPVVQRAPQAPHSQLTTHGGIERFLLINPRTHNGCENRLDETNGVGAEMTED